MFEGEIYLKYYGLSKIPIWDLSVYQDKVAGN